MKPIYQQPFNPYLSYPIISFNAFDSYLAESNLDLEIREKLLNLKEWLVNRLCYSNSKLGRQGVVCPYTKKSVKEDLFYFSVFDQRSEDLDVTYNNIFIYMQALLQKFIDSKLDIKEDVFRTYVAVFPLMRREQTAVLIDHMHVKLKPFFIKKGLMLGQFHQDCNIGGIHNPKFMALHAPLPLFVIRNIVLNDYLFLKHQPEFVEEYKKFCEVAYPKEFQEYWLRVKSDKDIGQT